MAEPICRRCWKPIARAAGQSGRPALTHETCRTPSETRSLAYHRRYNDARSRGETLAPAYPYRVRARLDLAEGSVSCGNCCARVAFYETAEVCIDGNGDEYIDMQNAVYACRACGAEYANAPERLEFRRVAYA